MLKLVLFCFVLAIVNAKPLQKEDEDDLGLNNPDLIEGDIIPDDQDEQVRTAVVKDKKLWPNGKIPYEISSKLSEATNEIRAAMKHIENRTCIRFVKRTTEKDYVRIYKGSGCSSKVGMSGKVQDLSLGEGCIKSGKIIHELGHAIGFYHEQTRSDRDDYIKIHWNNIKAGSESQFTKRKPSENRLLTAYDYDSVMHYGSLTFSKDKAANLKTMTPKKAGAVLKSVSDKDLSKDDIKRIKTLYKCK